MNCGRGEKILARFCEHKFLFSRLIHTSELTISVLGLVLNCIVSLLTHRAAPIPYAQRRQLVTFLTAPYPISIFCVSVRSLPELRANQCDSTLPQYLPPLLPSWTLSARDKHSDVQVTGEKTAWIRRKIESYSPRKIVPKCNWDWRGGRFLH